MLLYSIYILEEEHFHMHFDMYLNFSFTCYKLKTHLNNKVTHLNESSEAKHFQGLTQLEKHTNVRC